MGRAFAVFVLLGVTEVIAFAQPAPLTTTRNSSLFFAASSLTTNGIPGLTNGSPRLMVSSVAPISSQGGSVMLVNTQVWVRRYDGTGSGPDSGIQVVVDASGNVIVTGYSVGQTSGYDFATVKYAVDGRALWTNRYDGPLHRNDFVRYLAVDGAGDVYVLGDSEDVGDQTDIVMVKYSASGAGMWTNRFNPSGTNQTGPGGLAVDSVGNSYFSFYTDDANPTSIIIKYDPLGIAVWTNRYKGSPDGSDYAALLAVDSAGNLFATCGSDGIGTGFNYATIKYAADGVGLWTNRYVRGFDDIPSYMILDRAGNVIVTGDVFGVSEHLYATIKYASNGKPLWTNLLTAPDYQGGNVPTLAADIAGNVFITGGSPGAGGTNADFAMVKLTSNGLPVWTSRFFENNSGNPYPAGTVADNAGNFFFAGHSRDSNEVNYVTVKFDGDGVSLVTNHYNGPSSTDDYANSVAASDNGNVYVTGLSSGWQEGLDFATVAYADYVLYTPPTNFTGTDTFAFTVVDYLGNVATSIVSVAVLPPSLQFNTAPTNLQLTPQGMRLQVDGASGTNPVVLYASSNLVDWLPINTNSPVQGSASFLDSAATNYPRRFYRALQ